MSCNVLTYLTQSTLFLIQHVYSLYFLLCPELLTLFVRLRDENGERNRGREREKGKEWEIRGRSNRKRETERERRKEMGDKRKD